MIIGRRHLFTSQGRERVGAPAERFAADASRPGGGVVAQGALRPPRDLEREREWTRLAGESVELGVERLVVFAEHRAGYGPVRDLAGRDFLLEVREELADARNYLVWCVLQASQQPMPAGEEPDGELIQLAICALASVVEGFDFVSRAQRRKAAV
jgi:hypothetical protein